LLEDTMEWNDPTSTSC